MATTPSMVPLVHLSLHWTFKVTNQHIQCLTTLVHNTRCANHSQKHIRYKFITSSLLSNNMRTKRSISIVHGNQKIHVNCYFHLTCSLHVSSQKVNTTQVLETKMSKCKFLLAKESNELIIKYREVEYINKEK